MRYLHGSEDVHCLQRTAFEHHLPHTRAGRLGPHLPAAMEAARGAREPGPPADAARAALVVDQLLEVGAAAARSADTTSGSRPAGGTDLP